MATSSMAPRKRKSVRFRLNVPADDQESLAFVASQHNLSASLRKLMHDHVERVGVTDVTSAPVTPDQLQAAIAAGSKTPERASGKAAKALEGSAAGGGASREAAAGPSRGESPDETEAAANDAGPAQDVPKPPRRARPKMRSMAEEPVPDYPDPNDAIRKMMGD